MIQGVKILALMAGCFAVGFFVGTRRPPKGILSATANYRGSLVRLGNTDLINPLLWCDIVGDNEVIPEYQPIQAALQTKIDAITSSGSVKNVSLYLMTLNTARRVMINENEHFSPASMLKVVIMMAYEKMADADPSILQHQITYDGSFDEDTIEITKNPEPLVIGKSYTVEALIANMIVDSGNNSRRLLKEYLASRDPQYLNSVYTDLRLGSPPADGGDYMTPRQYSGIFRVLYSATYLSRAASQSSLKLLTQSAFHAGLAGGVADGVTVAHKFGERQLTNTDGSVVNEFHDCGIVYYPKHPYFLCLMTKGDDQTALVTAVHDLSHETYAQMDNYFTNLLQLRQHR